MRKPSRLSRFITALFCLPLLIPGSAFSQQLLAGEREAVVTGIPGVVEQGAHWSLVWADFVTADGIMGTPGWWRSVRTGTNRQDHQINC